MGAAVYFPGDTAGYNWTAIDNREPVVSPELEELKNQHADNFGWALACCAWHRESAEDVLQEAYLRVLDGRAGFGGKSSRKTWFFAVIKRVAADSQRTQKRRSILNMRMVAGGEAFTQDEALRANPLADAIQGDEATLRLQLALQQVSQRQREVLHLVFYSGLTLEEAAETLQVGLGSARTHYHRGKERLAQLLTQQETYER
jgi:RNA polymerase sigma factor (sigma-70 family)